MTDLTRISGVVWWPNDGEDVTQVNVRISDDPFCDPSSFRTGAFFTDGVFGGFPFFQPSSTTAGGPVNGELFQLDDPGVKVHCFEFTLTGCTNECSIGEVAFIGPDPTVPPVTPP